MLGEIKTKGNQRYDVLRYAYQHYRQVAVVSEDIVPPTVEISGKEENVSVVYPEPLPAACRTRHLSYIHP